MAQARRHPAAAKPLPAISPRLARLGREILVIAFAALTLYLLVCLLSYSQQDASWTFTGGSDDVRNLGGRFGAWFSDLVLHAFGYSAYLFPLIFALLSWRTQQYQKEPPARYVRLVHTIGMVLAVLSACGLEYIHFAREIVSEKCKNAKFSACGGLKPTKEYKNSLSARRRRRKFWGSKFTYKLLFVNSRI